MTSLHGKLGQNSSPKQSHGAIQLVRGEAVSYSTLRSQGFEPRDNRKQIQLWARLRRGLNSGPVDYNFSALSARPRCLFTDANYEKKVDCVKMTIARSRTSQSTSQSDTSVKDTFYEDSKSEQKTP